MLSIAFASVLAAGRLFRAVFACMLLVPFVAARAELMLHPTRIVFDNNTRAAQIELINTGSKPASYRMSLVNRRMTEAGQFEAAETAQDGERFADPMLRYSPRQITLQPGTAQTVRVMLRKPAELAAGEYRSHLQFDKLPEVEGRASIESKGADPTRIGVVLNALVGASVPVIVRHGAADASIALAGLALRKDEAGRDQLVLQFERAGGNSVYGDVSVTFTPGSGKPHTLARISGIAVYTPNRVRKATLALDVPAGLALAGGLLEVSYRDRPEAGGKLLAQASLHLP
ncbi:molecular chaperone [Massilia jejuensis]|uniref:Molecular chaperone n=1 Tax=Massilia jejuensis TaxID=648894 RepID=A0ABW0PH16_9BURK